MRWQWVVDDGARPFRELVVEADPELAVGVLAEALGLSVWSLTGTSDGEVPVRLAAPPSGSVLPWVVLPVHVGEFGMRFRSGPLAGSCVPLPRSSVSVGRAVSNSVSLADSSVSREQFLLGITDEAVSLHPCMGAAPVRLNGKLLNLTGFALTPTDLVEVGSSVLTVGELPLPRADLAPDGAGGLAFNRPGRIRARRFPPRVILAGARPEDTVSAPLPWIAALVPLVMASGLAWATGQPTMLLMAGASPVMVFGNYRAQRKSSAKRVKSSAAKWREARALTRQQLADATDSERLAAWETSLDPALAREICVGRAAVLWERRVTDADALLIRVGVAELPVPVKIDGSPGHGEAMPEPFMSPVPVQVDLATAGVFGIAGPSRVTRPLGRWLVLQLATARSPRDLRVVLLCPDNAETSWRWTRWLPHLQPDGVHAPVALIGNTDATRKARVQELADMVEERLRTRKAEREVAFADQTVLVLDGARRFRELSGMSAVLRDGPKVGVFAICMDEDRARLPEEVTAELLVDEANPTLALFAVSQQQTVSRVLLDAVSAEIAEECARSLAPLRHVGGDGDKTALPPTVRFVDLLGVDLNNPDWVASRWAQRGRSTRAVVGTSGDGPLLLDLVGDGPHGLVAGTTGAGKSEFLQTFVVSLALENRPDALTFVLVDYKGASAFADCARLPHTVGMVTNLDNRETERALASLDAELVRRERVLKEMAVPDADAAWERDPEKATANGLARLVIVIDEFAELLHELPEFVTGLIRIARVGRSLGVHLVLATQRPAGIVSGEMQANLSLRVALRMVEKTDSTEVLGTGESATISPATPGRAYVRRTTGTPPTEFQAARVAGRRPGVHADRAPAPVIKQVGWADLGEPQVLTSRVDKGDPEATDLRALVDLIDTAAEQTAIPRRPSPWLPALPTVLTIAELAEKISTNPARHAASDDGVAVGLLDVPAEQAQRGLFYRVSDGRHWMIGGSARSGRSTVLRTLLAGVADKHSPDDVHLYGMDFGTGALLPLRDLPHCGAIVTGTETDRVVRLLTRLTEELARRQVILSTHGYGDITEQRAATTRSGVRLPHIVVAIDRWEGFTAAYPVEQLQVLRERVIKILREGPACGVLLVITGDKALIGDRIAGFIETRYTLRMADREEFRLVNVRPASLPEQIPDGRAYFGDPVSEVHFAALSNDLSGQGQTTELRRIVTDIAACHQAQPLTHRPFRLDVLPTHITLTETLRLPVATDADRDALHILIGVGGDDCSQHWIDFAHGPGFLIAGQRKTGRSTTLAVIAQQFHAANVPVLLIATKTSPATALAAVLGITRINQIDSDAADQATAWIGERQRCVVLVDDADTVHGSDLDNALIDLAQSRAAGTFALIAAAPLTDLGIVLRGVAVEARRHKQGVLLSPTSSLEGNLLGGGIDRALLGRAGEGRALMLLDGDWSPIQIPLPDKSVV